MNAMGSFDGSLNMASQPDQSLTNVWESVTEKVIGCAFKVANTLGPGFLEKVYENALALEIARIGLNVVQQCAIDVVYEGVVVGHFAADLIVNDLVLVELKAGKANEDVHTAQCINYLKATGKPVCLLLNFGTARIGVKRLLNPSVPEAWVHPADDCGDETQPDPSIRVHPCPSVAQSR